MHLHEIYMLDQSTGLSWARVGGDRTANGSFLSGMKLCGGGASALGAAAGCTVSPSGVAGSTARSSTVSGSSNHLPRIGSESSGGERRSGVRTTRGNGRRIATPVIRSVWNASLKWPTGSVAIQKVYTKATVNNKIIQIK